MHVYNLSYWLCFYVYGAFCFSKKSSSSSPLATCSVCCTKTAFTTLITAKPIAQR